MKMTVSGKTAICTVVELLIAPSVFGAESSDSGAAAAPDLTYVLRAGAYYTDNLFLLPEGQETSAGAGVFGVTANGQRDSGRLTYQTNANLSYYAYFRDYDSQIFGDAAFDGAVAIVPDRIFWNGRVNYNQVRENAASPMAPGNMSDQLIWSTGPEVHLRMGSFMEAQLSGHYQRAGYSGAQSVNDSETAGGRALLARRSNPRTLLAVGAAYDDVSYADDALSVFDFKRKEYFAHYATEGVRTRLTAEAGYATINGDAFEDKGLMFRGSLNRRLTPTLEGSLNYAHEYPTSASAGFMTNPLVPGVGGPDQTILTTAPRGNRPSCRVRALSRAKPSELLDSRSIALSMTNSPWS
jgi:hypothetical protein